MKVSGSVNKLNIQIRTKINEPGICSLCLFQGVKEKVLKTSVDTTWYEVFTSGPGCGLHLEILSHSLEFTWKPMTWREMLVLGYTTQPYGDNTPALGGNGLQLPRQSLGFEDVSYQQKFSLKSTSLIVNYKTL